MSVFRTHTTRIEKNTLSQVMQLGATLPGG